MLAYETASPPPKVFTDLVESVACDRDEVLRTLEEHIVGNLVRLGPQHFLQTEVRAIVTVLCVL